jgi:CDP-diacylglycerol--serine O-phosphatidyltransferase
MKQIPNLFTLLNLVFGCIAIVFILQTNESIVALDDTNLQVVVLPEKIAIGALFIFGAAVIDFLDGFLARLMKAQSEMGKQLDSLSDVVSFGVAPGMILYQLLRMSFAQNENGLDVSFLALVPAFIFTAAVAWRLAKFNISTNQANSFIGVPSPAAGLFVASLPLIILEEMKSGKALVSEYLVNQWVLYIIIIALAYLMVCNLRFMALKFKDFSIQKNLLKYVLLAVALVSILLLKWLAVPIIFILYLVFSIFSKEPATGYHDTQRETLDVTV